MKDEITEKTSVPLSILGPVLIALVGAIMWLTTLSVTANGTRDKVEQIQTKFEAHEAQHEEEEKSIDERLSRMEGYFQRLLKNH